MRHTRHLMGLLQALAGLTQLPFLFKSREHRFLELAADGEDAP